MLRFYVYKLIEGAENDDESYRLIGEVTCADEDDAAELAEMLDDAKSPYYTLDANFVDEGFTVNS